jgi:hypothetical protein
MHHSTSSSPKQANRFIFALFGAGIILIIIFIIILNVAMNSILNSTTTDSSSVVTTTTKSPQKREEIQQQDEIIITESITEDTIRKLKSRIKTLEMMVMNVDGKQTHNKNLPPRSRTIKFVNKFEKN